MWAERWISRLDIIANWLKNIYRIKIPEISSITNTKYVTCKTCNFFSLFLIPTSFQSFFLKRITIIFTRLVYLPSISIYRDHARTEIWRITLIWTLVTRPTGLRISAEPAIIFINGCTFRHILLPSLCGIPFVYQVRRGNYGRRCLCIAPPELQRRKRDDGSESEEILHAPRPPQESSERPTSVLRLVSAAAWRWQHWTTIETYHFTKFTSSVIFITYRFLPRVCHRGYKKKEG